jgi:chitin disaccharide deacetylase
VIDRRLCITADDYGAAASYDRAVEELAALGVVQAVSVMAHRDAALDEAPRLARAGVATGLHLVFTAERPISRRLVGSPLVDAQGRMPGSFRQLFLKLCARPWMAELLHEEGALQARRMRDAGLRIDFINSHEHTHLFPLLWPTFARLTDDLGVPAVRVALHQRVDASLQGGLSAASRISWARAPLPRRVVMSPLGVGRAGALTIGGIEALLKRPFAPPPGGNALRELCVHPHPGERAMLGSAELQVLLARLGVRPARPGNGSGSGSGNGSGSGER